jgi:soluble lytic murein transglycosylase-like protein
MLPVILAASILAAPAPTKTERLEAYILKINAKAKPYAKRLATCIFGEAKRFKLDPAVLAAVAHTESHYRRNCQGRWYEVGIFQVWPYAPFLRPAWDALRQARYGLPGWPDSDWHNLSWKQKKRAGRDVCISAFLAAFILKYHVTKCGSQKPQCVAAYNSGNHRKVRPGYHYMIKKRTKAIRKALKP